MAATDIPTEADYVIIGGGTAGLVLANRLSEDPNVSVVVLEAGNDLRQDLRVNIPALWSSLLGSDADWNFTTTPQRGLSDRIIKEPQGKLLGGSSAINAQSWIAASQATIDSWSKAGNSTWTWDALFPYYKKSYTFHPPENEAKVLLNLDWIEEDVHGTSGPVHVSFPAIPQDPIAQSWIEAFKSLGYQTSADPHSGTSIGAYCNLASIDPIDKTRSYAASAYLTPAVERPNLRVITNATVQRVILDNRSHEAIATHVRVDIRGHLHDVRAQREIIVSAGVFNTPKILELSGIGNKAVLTQHSIPMVIEIPNVGENLQDHLMSGISFEVAEGIMTGDPLIRQESDAIKGAMQMYSEHKTGPMTIGGVVSSSFMPVLEFGEQDSLVKQSALLDQFVPTTNISEYQRILRNILENPDESTCSMFIIPIQANLHENTERHHGNYITMGIIQSVPFSRGSVHVSSTDSNTNPLIDPRYFSHPLDIEIMARNLLDMERLHEVDALAQLFKSDGKRNHPDAFVTDRHSAKKYLHDTATTTYHSCGTASMLPRDKGGVVDEELRVYGTKNLRVVDASIFPVSPRANLMTTVYAVAERAADIIRSAA